MTALSRAPILYCSRCNRTSRDGQFRNVGPVATPVSQEHRECTRYGRSPGRCPKAFEQSWRKMSRHAVVLNRANRVPIAYWSPKPRLYQAARQEPSLPLWLIGGEARAGAARPSVRSASIRRDENRWSTIISASSIHMLRSPPTVASFVCWHGACPSPQQARPARRIHCAALPYCWVNRRSSTRAFFMRRHCGLFASSRIRNASS
jgi:hypothetical protein